MRVGDDASSIVVIEFIVAEASGIILFFLGAAAFDHIRRMHRAD